MRSCIFLVESLVVLMNLSPVKLQTQDVASLKFNQHGYTIVHDRLEVESYNKEVASYTNIFCYWFNRTTRVINFTMSLVKDVDDVKLAVQLYKFMSNEYRCFPLAFQFDLCAALENDAFGAADMRKCGNLYTHCVYRKSKIYKSSSLWCLFSKLKCMLRIKDNIDISNFPKLTAFLKNYSVGYAPEKSAVFSKEQLIHFFVNAPNDKYLLMKNHTYRFCNWLVDATKFPPYIPFGKYKLSLMLKYGDISIGNYSYYGAVQEIHKWN